MERVLRVDFGVHVAKDSIGSMVTGLGAYGLVHQDHTDSRCYIVELVRPGKWAKLKRQLTQWESYGFLRWREISSTG